MIVRSQTPDELVLVSQCEHSKLVGQIAAHWGNATFERPKPFGSVVRAAAYHDYGWVSYESEPLFDPERRTTPHYLDVPGTPERWQADQDCVDWLSRVDRYSAVLASMHRTGLSQGRYGVIEHPKAYLQPAGRKREPLVAEGREFIARNEDMQRSERKTLGDEAVWTNYRLLQVWDLLGLYFSCHEPDELTIRPVPYGYETADTAVLTIAPVDARTVAFAPFPFVRPGCEISLAMKRLRRSELTDADAFLRHYYGAPVETLTFKLV